MFKTEFLSLKPGSIVVNAAEWQAYSDVYRVLVDPTHAVDAEIEAALRHINVFGTVMHPIVMAVYRDFQEGNIDRDVLLVTLEQLQALWLRKMVVGESRDHLAAQLCRRWRTYGHPIRDIVRRTPSDERIRSALQYRPLPHAGYRCLRPLLPKHQ